jgi:UDP-N-acetylglucosamine--N-acetylmuramyl-(pentapeptide) pyrophosphoryl-undecaprenol N-acetylglucosamine transferase
LSTRNAALLIKDNMASETLVDEAIKLISDKSRRDMLSENILKMADRDADIRIAREILKLATK